MRASSKRLGSSAQRGDTLFANLPKKMLGFCILKSGDIIIDLKKEENVVRVYLHELLHRQYPKLDEYAVLRMEIEIWACMSQEQVFEMGKLLFNRKYKGVANDCP